MTLTATTLTAITWCFLRSRNAVQLQQSWKFMRRQQEMHLTIPCLILPWVHCVHITTQTDLTSTLSIHSPMPWKPNTRKGVYTQLGHTKLILCFTDPAGSFFFFFENWKKNVKMQLICTCNPAILPFPHFSICPGGSVLMNSTKHRIIYKFGIVKFIIVETLFPLMKLQPSVTPRPMIYCRCILPCAMMAFHAGSCTWTMRNYNITKSENFISATFMFVFVTGLYTEYMCCSRYSELS